MKNLKFTEEQMKNLIHFNIDTTGEIPSELTELLLTSPSINNAVRSAMLQIILGSSPKIEFCTFFLLGFKFAQQLAELAELEALVLKN